MAKSGPSDYDQRSVSTKSGSSYTQIQDHRQRSSIDSSSTRSDKNGSVRNVRSRKLSKIHSKSKHFLINEKKSSKHRVIENRIPEMTIIPITPEPEDALPQAAIFDLEKMKTQRMKEKILRELQEIKERVQKALIIGGYDKDEDEEEEDTGFDEIVPSVYGKSKLLMKIRRLQKKDRNTLIEDLDHCIENSFKRVQNISDIYDWIEIEQRDLKEILLRDAEIEGTDSEEVSKANRMILQGLVDMTRTTENMTTVGQEILEKIQVWTAQYPEKHIPRIAIIGEKALAASRERWDLAASRVHLVLKEAHKWVKTLSMKHALLNTKKQFEIIMEIANSKFTELSEVNNKLDLSEKQNLILKKLFDRGNSDIEFYKQSLDNQHLDLKNLKVKLGQSKEMNKRLTAQVIKLRAKAEAFQETIDENKKDKPLSATGATATSPTPTAGVESSRMTPEKIAAFNAEYFGASELKSTEHQLDEYTDRIEELNERIRELEELLGKQKGSVINLKAALSHKIKARTREDLTKDDLTEEKIQQIYYNGRLAQTKEERPYITHDQDKADKTDKAVKADADKKVKFSKPKKEETTAIEASDEKSDYAEDKFARTVRRVKTIKKVVKRFKRGKSKAKSVTETSDEKEKETVTMQDTFKTDLMKLYGDIEKLTAPKFGDEPTSAPGISSTTAPGISSIRTPGISPTSAPGISSIRSPGISPTSARGISPTSTTDLSLASVPGLSPLSVPGISPTSPTDLSSATVPGISPTSTTGLSFSSTQGISPTSAQGFLPTDHKQISPQSTQSISPAGEKGISSKSSKKGLSKKGSRSSSKKGKSSSGSLKSLTPKSATRFSSGSVKAVSPQTTKAILPETTQAVSPDTKQVVSPETKRVVSPDTKQVVSPDTKQVVSPDTKRVVSPETKQAVSPETKQIVSPETKQVVSPDTKRVVSPETKPVVSPESKIKQGSQDVIPIGKQTTSPSSVEATSPSSLDSTRALLGSSKSDPSYLDTMYSRGSLRVTPESNSPESTSISLESLRTISSQGIISPETSPETQMPQQKTGEIVERQRTQTTDTTEQEKPRIEVMRTLSQPLTAISEETDDKDSVKKMFEPTKSADIPKIIITKPPSKITQALKKLEEEKSKTAEVQELLKKTEQQQKEQLIKIKEGWNSTLQTVLNFCDHTASVLTEEGYPNTAKDLMKKTLNFVSDNLPVDLNDLIGTVTNHSEKCLETVQSTLQNLLNAMHFMDRTKANEAKKKQLVWKTEGQNIEPTIRKYPQMLDLIAKQKAEKGAHGVETRLEQELDHGEEYLQNASSISLFRRSDLALDQSSEDTWDQRSLLEDYHKTMLQKPDLYKKPKRKTELLSTKQPPKVEMTITPRRTIKPIPKSKIPRKRGSISKNEQQIMVVTPQYITKQSGKTDKKQSMKTDSKDSSSKTKAELTVLPTEVDDRQTEGEKKSVDLHIQTTQKEKLPLSPPAAKKERETAVAVDLQMKLRASDEQVREKKETKPVLPSSSKDVRPTKSEDFQKQLRYSDIQFQGKEEAKPVLPSFRKDLRFTKSDDFHKKSKASDEQVKEEKETKLLLPPSSKELRPTKSEGFQKQQRYSDIQFSEKDETKAVLPSFKRDLRPTKSEDFHKQYKDIEKKEMLPSLPIDHQKQHKDDITMIEDDDVQKEETTPLFPASKKQMPSTKAASKKKMPPVKPFLFHSKKETISSKPSVLVSKKEGPLAKPLYMSSEKQEPPAKPLVVDTSEKEVPLAMTLAPDSRIQELPAASEDLQKKQRDVKVRKKEEKILLAPVYKKVLSEELRMQHRYGIPVHKPERVQIVQKEVIIPVTMSSTKDIQPDVLSLQKKMTERMPIAVADTVKGKEKITEPQEESTKEEKLKKILEDRKKYDLRITPMDVRSSSKEDVEKKESTGTKKVTYQEEQQEISEDKPIREEYRVKSLEKTPSLLAIFRALRDSTEDHAIKEKVCKQVLLKRRKSLISQKEAAEKSKFFIPEKMKDKTRKPLEDKKEVKELHKLADAAMTRPEVITEDWFYKLIKEHIFKNRTRRASLDRAASQKEDVLNQVLGEKQVLHYFERMHHRMHAGLASEKEEFDKLQNERQNLFIIMWMLLREAFKEHGINVTIPAIRKHLSVLPKPPKPVKEEFELPKFGPMRRHTVPHLFGRMRSSIPTDDFFQIKGTRIGTYIETAFRKPIKTTKKVLTKPLLFKPYLTKLDEQKKYTSGRRYTEPARYILHDHDRKRYSYSINREILYPLSCCRSFQIQQNAVQFIEDE